MRILILLLIFHSHIVSASCLPEVMALGIPPAAFSCLSDDDCAVAGDACRSCQNPIAINKKYLELFLKLDNEARRKIKCVLTCEACSMETHRFSCIGGKCRGSKIK